MGNSTPYLDFTFQLHLNVVQEAQVQLLANNVRLALLQQQPTPMVGLLDAPEKVRRDIIGIVLRRTDRDCSPIGVLLTVCSYASKSGSVFVWDDSGSWDEIVCRYTTDCAD